VVIKTLGETMQKIPGISGGAIMPNGRVGLIVDIAGLMKLTVGTGSESAVRAGGFGTR
jgi:two-component system chemotaxis sensor kinase CheA